MAEHAGDNGSNGATPPFGTAPPFDSLANLRALGDIQRRGLEAANQVVGRLIDRVDRSGPLFGAEPTGTLAGAAPGAAADPFTQYAELWSSFLATLFAGGPVPWMDGAAAASPAGASSADASPVGVPDAAVVADPLTVDPVHPGKLARRRCCWLRNRSGRGRQRCSPPLRRPSPSRRGSAIPSSAVSFDPALIDTLPDLSSSRGVRVAIDVPAGAHPGVHRTTVMASNLPDVWMVLELDVVGAVTTLDDDPDPRAGPARGVAHAEYGRPCSARRCSSICPTANRCSGCTAPCASTRRGPARRCGRRCACRPAGRSEASPTTCSASPWQSSCCTTPFWCTTTSPTAARCAAAGRRWPREHGLGRRAQRRRRPGGRGAARCCAGPRVGFDRGPRRSGVGGVRHHGDAHPGGSGDRGRLATRQCRAI